MAPSEFPRKVIPMLSNSVAFCARRPRLERPIRDGMLLATIILGLVTAFGKNQIPDEGEIYSQYVSMRDGVKLAVDVYLPERGSDEARFPALLYYTRYWRSSENPSTGLRTSGLDSLDRFFLEHGYAVVKIDARGSGASFGTRLGEYSPPEVLDGYEIVEWVVNQRWSSGVVGAYGTSYTGTTAELFCASGHPAVKAVIPGWSDFEVYSSPVRPYGLLASSFIKAWSDMVHQLDMNDVNAMGASVRRVDSDPDGSVLRAAVLDHRSNPNVYESAVKSEFRNQKFGSQYMKP